MMAFVSRSVLVTIDAIAPNTFLERIVTRVRVLISHVIDFRLTMCFLAASLPRSCEQHFQFSNHTGRVLIDLDGGHELRPFTVQCSKSAPIDYGN